MTPRRKSPAAAATAPARAVKLRRRWASLPEAAEYYRMSVDTIKLRIAEGGIKGYRIPGGTAIRVDLNEIDASMVTVPSAIRP